MPMARACEPITALVPTMWYKDPITGHRTVSKCHLSMLGTWLGLTWVGTVRVTCVHVYRSELYRIFDSSGTENRDFTGKKRISRVSRIDCRFHGIVPKTANFTDPWHREKRRALLREALTNITLSQVALHELGHALGLKHSEEHRYLKESAFSWICSFIDQRDMMNSLEKFLKLLSVR